MEKYQIIKQIGSGSFGVVWKAMNKRTGEVVAIKELKEERYNSIEECMKLREVRSLIKMNNHPNIVKLKEVILKESILFLVLEYMECDLEKLIDDEIRTEPFSEAEIRNVCFQILQGLAYMHHNGYFHRDLKPGNVLVSKNVVKIGDLGSVRETSSQKPYTHQVTTVCYRAPEVFLRAPVYDSSVDMWAVGAIMAELYTNEPVFYYEGDVMLKICSVLGTPTEATWSSGLDLARDICYKLPDFPGVRFSELLPSASPDAVNLITSLLSWCPSDRPTAMQALQHPFFHGCYRVPPTVRLEVFKRDKQRELLKETRSLRSCASGSERVDTYEDQIAILEALNPFEFMK